MPIGAIILGGRVRNREPLIRAITDLADGVDDGLRLGAEATDMPIFAHVNWFQRDSDGRFRWPGYGENLRTLLWLIDLKQFDNLPDEIWAAHRRMAETLAEASREHG